jgi:hypothetical protein
MRYLQRNTMRTGGGENCTFGLQSKTRKSLDKGSRKFIASANDARNGLLLCPSCNAHFIHPSDSDPMKTFIQIAPDGSIILNGKAKEINYKNSNGKRVPWSFGEAYYPSPATLKLGLTLQRFEDTRLKELQDAYEEEHFEDENEESDEESKEERTSNRKRTREETEKKAEYPVKRTCDSVKKPVK